MKFKLFESKKNLICYNTETGDREDNLYKPEDFEIYSYKILDDGTLNVLSSAYLNYKHFSFLPFQFNIVMGNFLCYGNKLKSLKGSPSYVKYAFDCHRNKLKDLKDSPTYIGAGFYCHQNKLTSLKGSPIYVGSINVSQNKLTSLSGRPKFIKGKSFHPWNSLVDCREDQNNKYFYK